MSGVEEWRPIPEFPGYEVSDRGRVRSWRRCRRLPIPHVLRAAPDTDGRPFVQFFTEGRRVSYRVCVLVALVFIGPRPDGLEIRHLDGDCCNNVPANLAYGTQSENTLDRVRHGTHHNATKTECVNGHPYDDANTYVRSGERACRTCHRAHQRRYLAKVAAQ